MQRVTSVSPNEVAVSTAVILNGKEQPGASIELFDSSGGSRVTKGIFIYNPPQNYFPAEQMQVGMRWKLGYEAVAPLFSSVPSHTINGEARVVSQEALKAEVGTLNAFKVEMVTYSSVNPGEPSRCLFWLSLDALVPVRMNCTLPIKGQATARMVTQLKRVKRAA